MIKITKQKDIDAYYNSSNFSQSEGKPLLISLKAYLNNKNYSKSGDGLKIGKAVDEILTGYEEDFYKRSHFSNLNKLPTEKVQAVVLDVRSSLVIQCANLEGELDDESISKLKAIDFDDCDEEILNAINKNNYYANRTDEKRISDIKAVGKDYFNDLIASIGKVIYSQDEKILIDQVVKSLRTSKNTAKYFNRDKQEGLKRVVFHYQYPIYFEHKGVACKALLDLVVFVFDENEKLISIEPIDLKTTYEDTLNFKYVAKKLRYDLQGAWYTLALTKAFATFPDVTLKPFKFIVESTTTPGTPLVYTMSKALLERGANGRPAVSLVNTDFNFEGENAESVIILPEVKGYEQMIDEYLFYQMNGFTVDRRVVESKGVFELDFD